MKDREACRAVGRLIGLGEAHLRAVRGDDYSVDCEYQCLV